MFSLPSDVLVAVLYPLCHEKTLQECVHEYPILEIITHHPQFSVAMAGVYTAQYGYLNLLKHFDLQGVEVARREQLIVYAVDLAVVQASAHDHLQVVQYLVLSQGANVRYQDDLAVIEASWYGHLQVVQYLVSQGADVRARHDSAVVAASENGHLEVVQYLVSQGADVRARYDEAVAQASKNGHLEVVRYLVSQGAHLRVLRWHVARGGMFVYYE